ncbi:MAG: hypothetical protein KJ573_12295, partial [Proteobacteria bacterium]|nr:hypothetical protein [Pseudomonadota bacterium]
EKCSILFEFKPPAQRAYAPEGRVNILKFEPDPSTIFRSYGAGAEIGPLARRGEPTPRRAKGGVLQRSHLLN